MGKLPPRAPSVTPCFDPNAERYWDARDLEQELVREFQICSDCRMCVTYCGSFPILFNAIDREVDAGRAHGAETVSAATIAEVTDHCWQCKLCYIKCPYTADEAAYELLDFPRLMAREKALRSRRDGVPVVDQVLGEPQLLGKLTAGAPARLANFVNAQSLVRRATQAVTGISARFPLPTFTSEPFARWMRDRQATTTGDAGEVVLFATCYGEYNYPEVPRAAVLVLEKNGFSVLHDEGTTCCGMPNLDGGDLDRARAKMQTNVSALLPYVRRGAKIVTPGPTCGYTMKKEWPEYLGTPEAREVAAATLDLMEFLDVLRREKRLSRDFERGFGKVAYHAACHLRAQKVGTPGARLLGLLPDTDVRIVERCSAVDGTWGMKARYYEEGARYGARLGKALQGDEPALYVGDCSLAGQRVLEQTGTSLLHPVQVLAAAYGLTPVPQPRTST